MDFWMTPGARALNRIKTRKNFLNPVVFMAFKVQTFVGCGTNTTQDLQAGTNLSSTR